MKIPYVQFILNLIRGGRLRKKRLGVTIKKVIDSVFFGKNIFRIIHKSFRYGCQKTDSTPVNTDGLAYEESKA